MKEIEFFVNKFDFTETIDDVDVSFVSSIMRRRLSNTDKVALSVLNKTFSENIQYIVFSSRHGEVERLVKLISQYTEDKEVSPNTFSGSVHNYPAGFFLLNSKISVPYNAVAACENSISNGLLAALIVDYDNILYCYSDKNNDDYYSFSLNISKKEKENTDKCRIILTNNEAAEDDFYQYIKFFSGKINMLELPLYRIERL